MRAWATELGRFEGDDIKTALEAMRCDKFVEWPPTLFQFAELCREAKKRRMMATPALTGPKTEMPQHIREQLRAFVSSHKL